LRGGEGGQQHAGHRRSDGGEDRAPSTLRNVSLSYGQIPLHGVQQASAPQQRDHRGVQQRLDDVSLTTGHLLQGVAGLHLLEEQIDLPARAVHEGHLPNRQSLGRDVGDVKIVAAGPSVSHHHQAQSTTGSRACAQVTPAPEGHLHLGVQLVSAQPVDDFAQAAPDDPAGFVPLGISAGHNQRVGVFLEPGDEVAAVTIDGVKQLVAEVSQVEQQQMILHPMTHLRHRSVVLAARGELDGVRSLALDAHHHVKLGRRLRVVGTARRKALLQKLVQPDERGVRQEDVSKRSQQPPAAHLGLVQRLDQLGRNPEEHGQRHGEPIVKRQGRQLSSRALLVQAPQACQRSFPAGAKSQHHGPEQRHRIHLRRRRITSVSCTNRSMVFFEIGLVNCSRIRINWVRATVPPPSQRVLPTL